MKRSQPPQRRTSLRSSTPPRRRKLTPRCGMRIHDVDYMMRVKLLPCCAEGLGPCHGVIEADHAGRRGMSQKCDDTECIPLCTRHHRERTDFSGAFKDWTRERMRPWLDQKIAETQRSLSCPVLKSDLPPW